MVQTVDYSEDRAEKRAGIRKDVEISGDSSYSTAMDLYFTTGQAARQLGATQDAIRALCQAGNIEAEITRGGHWRVSAGEIDRLKREGLPPIAHPLPGEPTRPARPKPTGTHPVLLAPPSERVIASREDLVETETLVKKRKLELELQEVEDRLYARDREEKERQASDERAERAHIAEEEAKRRRELWLQKWEGYALNSQPYDATPELRLQVHDAVRKRLSDLDPVPDDQVTRKLVGAEVEAILAAWKRLRQIEEILIEARDRMLPYAARRHYSTEDFTPWQTAAVRAAVAAIGELPNRPIEEIRTAAKRAVRAVETGFDDDQMRQRAAREAIASLPAGLTKEARKLAETAISGAVAACPPGTSGPDLESACRKAIEPFRAALERQHAVEQDRVSRESVLNAAPWKLARLPTQEREKALATIREHIAQLPEGTPTGALQEAADQAIQPYLKAQAQRDRKEQLIREGLCEIFSYILKLQADWDFKGKGAWTLEMDIKESIRKRLEAELTGNETPERIPKIVRRLVRDELDIT